MRKPQAGFTIVELLIVIVVIAILAAIGIVAYNGIQARAKNSQTQSSLASWVKAIQMYKAENSKWPNASGCLGNGYKYGPTATDVSGIGQCRQTTLTSGVVESYTLNTMLAPYIGATSPSPSMTTAYSSDTLWVRGITYLYGGGLGTDIYFDVSYSGVLGSCPTVGGLSSSLAIFNGNSRCVYNLGQTTDI